MPARPIPLDPVLMMTRPQDRAAAFVAGLRANGAPPFRALCTPLIEIVATGAPVPEGISALIFTSANGVAAWQRAAGRSGIDAYCVGSATARAAEAAGLIARHDPTGGGDAAALVDWLIRTRPSGRLCHVRGAHARGDVAARLSAAGLTVVDAVLYDQRALPLSDAARAALAEDAPIVAPLFSPRSAGLFADGVAESPRHAPILVAAMSRTVADAAARLAPFMLITAETPSAASMSVLTRDLIEKATRLERRFPEV